MIEGAVLHGIEGWVRRRARESGLGIPDLDAAVHGALARYQRVIADLRMVDVAMRGAEVPYLVVKGPALVHQYYDGPEFRSFIDLDVVVRPKDLGAALEALERAGLELVDANWPLLTSLGVRELRVMSPAGGVIDLHWSLGYGPEAAQRAPLVDTLLDRSQTFRVGGLEVQVLDWADTVIHLALHAASSGGNRLIWCVDLRAVLAAAPPAGSQLLAQRAAEWRAAPALHVMLWRAHHSIGMPLSSDLVAALSPSRAWSGLVRLVERVAPVERCGPGPSLTRIVARSAGPDASSSWKALRRKAILVMRHDETRASPEQLRDPADPRSGLYPSGGEVGRRAFLAAVADDQVSPGTD